MKKLNPNWFAEGMIDFEFKKYHLLAYLKEVSAHFRASKLYPCLSDLVTHYQTLHSFIEQKSQLSQHFSRTVTGLNFEAGELEYELDHSENEKLQEIEQIVNYSIPRVKHYLDEGTEIYDFIEDQIEISSVGLLPLYKDAGYLLLESGKMNEIKAYQYEISIFEGPKDVYRAIKTSYMHSFQYGVSNTLEAIKLDLIRNNRALPNPATYFIYSPISFPEEPSLIPVAKRKFVRYLAKAG